MSWLRPLSALLHGVNTRRLARDTRRRQAAAIARYEQRHACCITVHGDCCPDTGPVGDPDG